tara:strand:+ start:399 stop:632 length:234 start_codon:yes stop_codon:yes gene_type:complete
MTKKKKLLTICESNMFWTPESQEELNARIDKHIPEEAMLMHMACAFQQNLIVNTVLKYGIENTEFVAAGPLFKTVEK